MNDYAYKTMAHIHSLKGEMDEITVLDKVGENDYIVDYKGVKCHALFNWFVCQFYADDIYRTGLAATPAKITGRSRRSTSTT